MLRDNPKKRIDYIDLMKGFCIIMVVLCHCGVGFEYRTLGWRVLEHMRMPLYFFLSGLFFKRTGGIMNLIVKKSNKLLLPYLFFAVLFLIPDVLVLRYDEMPDFLNATYFYWLLKEPTNNPVWFLKCLFWMYCFYYAVDKYLNRHIPKYAVLGVLVGVAWLTLYAGNFVKPFIADSKIVDLFFSQRVFAALIALPFFLIACETKSLFIENKFSIKVKFLAVIAASLVCIVCSEGEANYYDFIFEGNLLLMYLSGISGIFVIAMVSMLLKKLPYVSYLGRYSLIVLGTHYPVIRLFQHYGIGDVYCLGALALMVMPVLIWLLKKYCPYFTAQKDLFSLVDGRLILNRDLHKEQCREA